MSLGRTRFLYWLKTRVKRMTYVREVFRAALETWRLAFMRICRAVSGINRRKVVFSCFNARTYGDNLKPISEKLHEARPDAEIVWMFRNPSEKRGVVPDYVRACDPISLKGLYEYATARVWVDNFTLPRFLKRRAGEQFYMNTWHGDRAFKKIAYDMFPERRRRLEETCDAMLAGSAFGVKLLKSAFRYKGDIMNNGCPRNDCLVRNDPEAVRAIRAALGIAEGVKVLIYAPTFRDSTRTQAYVSGIDFARTLDDLETHAGGRWICLYRAHQLAKGGVKVRGDARVKDVTNYEDMADLLLISDALITDYSSSAMDFAIQGRRVFIYQDDIEEYTARDRQLYYRMEDSPFIVSHDQEELSRAIAATDTAAALANCRDIAEFFGFNESGHASEMAAARICEWIS